MAKKLDIVERAWKSKGGAVAMFFVFGGSVALLSILKMDYFTMNRILGRLILPGTLVVTPQAGGSWLGVDTITLVLSLMIYMLVGYVIDWFYKPNK